jgi:hypothetical protein
LRLFTYFLFVLFYFILFIYLIYLRIYAFITLESYISRVSVSHS